MVAFKTGDMVSALEGFKTIIRHKPEHFESIYNCASVCSKQHNFTEALEWLSRVYELGNTNVLYLITDPDLDDVLQDQESSIEIKKLIRKMYKKCIMDNFQCRFNNMIDLSFYNQRYKGHFTENDIDLLKKYNINPKMSLDFLKKIILSQIYQARFETCQLSCVVVQLWLSKYFKNAKQVDFK